LYEFSQNFVKIHQNSHGFSTHKFFIEFYMIFSLSANVQETMYSLVASHELLTVTSGFAPLCIFYTDGSLVEGYAGFASVFTTKLSAIFTALRYIAEVILPPERCLILTDSLSSIKAMKSSKIAHHTHPLVYRCKQLC
jgi:hypothetical protein